MYAVRRIQKVQNGTVVVELPPDFPASWVEVIVLPAEEEEAQMEPTDEKPAADLPPAVQEFLNLDTSQFTPEQREAYERAKQQIRRGRRPDEPRILGLFEGLTEVPDDFNDPLPKEIEDLFWGSETDEYGMSLDRS